MEKDRVFWEIGVKVSTTFSSQLFSRAVAGEASPAGFVGDQSAWKCTACGSPGPCESAKRRPSNGCQTVLQALGEARRRGPLCRTTAPMFSTVHTPGNKQRCEPKLALLSDARLGELTGPFYEFGMPPPLPSVECTPSRVLRLTSPPRSYGAGSNRRSASLSRV